MSENSARQFVDDAASSVKDAGRRTMDFIKGFYNKSSGYGIGGMVGGGLLAWVIGNAFGGGGLLGTVISMMLMPLMAKLGADFGETHLKPAFSSASAPPARQQSHAPAVTPTNEVSQVQQPTERVVAQAREQVKQLPIHNPRVVGYVPPSQPIGQPEQRSR